MADQDPDVEGMDPAPHKRQKPVRATRVTKAGVALDDLDDIMTRAQIAYRSRMLPKDVQNVEQAAMIIMTGLDMGLKPSAAFKYLYMTKGRRVTLTTKGGLSVVYRSGLCETYKEWTEGKGEEMVAVAFTKRKGMPDPFQKTFSYEDAKEAGLLGERTSKTGDSYDSTYEKYLRDMLEARARGRVLDVAYPDVLGGTPMEGVAEDIDRGEAEAEGQQVPREVSSGREQPALPAAAGPDPFLEALRKPDKKPEPEPIPVEAKVVSETPARQVEPEPPEEEEEDDQGGLFG